MITMYWDEVTYMRLVIYTQFRENYGAHDWDGKGECPQYWKNKGGSTYVVGCDIQQAQDPAFYDSVAKCIEHKSEYCEDYIIGESLVDDCDFDKDSVVESWDTAIYAEYIGGQLHCQEDVKDYTMERNVIGQRSWLQCKDGRYEMELEMFEEAA